MTTFEATTARLAIMETLSRYAWSYDTRDLALMATTFSADGCFHAQLAGSPGWGPFVGRQAIIDWLGDVMQTQTDQRRHCLTNLVFLTLTPTAATVASYLTLTAAEHGAVAIKCTGTYRDEMINEDGEWRIQRKTLVLDCAF